VGADALEAARALRPIDERALPFGKTVLLFDGVLPDGAPSGATRAQLAALGEIRNPGLADLFVAIMKGTYA
jgi:ABC-2 type transport system ATP-binding protein